MDRFAIYFAPAPSSMLWARGSAWLGRDAVTGGLLPQPEWADIAADEFQIVTRTPRRYGFHATIKAPTPLMPGRTAEELSQALAGFASCTAPVLLEHLVVRPFGGLLSIRLDHQPDRLVDLAARVVEQFEPFRAPLSQEARARRLAVALTPRQTQLLESYGYPYVMDEFRYHMTLSERCDDDLLARLSQAAEEWFAPTLEQPLAFDRLCLFHQRDEAAPFLRRQDFLLTGKA